MVYFGRFHPHLHTFCSLFGTRQDMESIRAPGFFIQVILSRLNSICFELPFHTCGRQFAKSCRPFDIQRPDRKRVSFWQRQPKGKQFTLLCGLLFCDFNIKRAVCKFAEGEYKLSINYDEENRTTVFTISLLYGSITTYLAQN